jgi:hypothetical protein
MRLRYHSVVLVLCLVVAVGLADDAAYSQPRSKSIDDPAPSIGPMIQSTSPVEAVGPSDLGKPDGRRPSGAPPLGVSFGGFNFLDNATNTGGWYFIPPDPIGAAGPFHVVNVGNVTIQWFNKVGVQQNQQSLQSFFAPLGPPLGTFTFDPKVIYDQYAERFVVIALERYDGSGVGDDSYILVAVSKTSDPNMGWWFLAIHSKTTIGAGDTWSDYPGLAVDDKAIYITTNMFPFSTSAGSYGVRLWIIDKNPFYSGGAASWSIHDPYAAAGVPGNEATTQPTHMFGALPGALGTYLCAYSGWTSGELGGSEWLHVIEVSDPLGGSGGPYFTQGWLNVGDIEDIGGSLGWPALVDAPQLGTTTRIEVNDRRALNAVWRDGDLYVSTTITPNAGADVNQTTAHWFRIDTSGGILGLNLADQGNVGAEDLGSSTFTFFPSVMVDQCGNMGIGFAASNQGIYPGAYYTGRLAGDAPGTVQPTGVLQAGLDYYVRTFGGTRNRWGDYSGLALDPADEETFWVYNEYAMTQGTPLGGLPELGRWATQWGSFALGCQPVAVAITEFDARAIADGVELTGAFITDSNQLRVNVYRAEGGFSEPVRYRTVELDGVTEFRYVDSFVEPGETYRYHIGVLDRDGEFMSPTMEVTIPTAETALFQNEPNPFNPTTTISFVLPTAQRARLSVYDASGKLVRTLVDGVTGYGTHHIEWDGTDNLGNEVGSGVYFYRLEAGKFQQSRKMVLLK